MTLRRASFGEKIWCFLASERFTAFLVIALSLVVLISNIVPQGREAIDIAASAAATPLHEAARWGLTEIFSTSWIKALGVLFAANILAMTANNFLGREELSSVNLSPPKNLKLSTRLSPRFPEKATPQLRASLESLFGHPMAESMQKDKTIMVFDSNKGAMWSAMMSHLGLIAILLGIGLYTINFDENSVSPQAILEVTDPKSGSSGIFNLRAGETRQFFTYPDSYMVRNYKRTKDGLGPAILLERRRKDAKRGESFWVYQSAPEGFDRRHRNEQVSIKALKLGRTPLPGAGLINSPIVLLLLGGIASIFLGLRASKGAGGRIWVELEHRELQISGVPVYQADHQFETDFEHCIQHLEQTVEQT